MKYEEFLSQTEGLALNRCHVHLETVFKLLAMIRELKNQRNELASIARLNPFVTSLELRGCDKRLDDIVNMVPADIGDIE